MDLIVVELIHEMFTEVQFLITNCILIGSLSSKLPVQIFEILMPMNVDETPVCRVLSTYIYYTVFKVFSLCLKKSLRATNNTSKPLFKVISLESCSSSAMFLKEI